MLVLPGFPDLVSLRSVESCLFHHPTAEVTVVLEGGGQELERHLATLQEVGYSINMTRQLEPGLPSPDWQIVSGTILMREVASEEGQGASRGVANFISWYRINKNTRLYSCASGLSHDEIN